ncbi:ABC transporter substrate-binding protein [Nakamurella leprariae]|uniref:Solute-binding protein family 5 domain-containing protein n=1 Tax=Nakamurella leprariae TaxID=2803911 RepID=A0A939C2J3_9ACTN|nr:ABC transporter substrate-binding protein [Nakamurella leprariae]MBM9468324.1 hypothetical protein [Nakamurella leprariae]
MKRLARSRTLAVGAVLTLVSTIGLAGCSSDSGSGGGSGGEGGTSTLRWAFSLPTSWDPVTSSTGNDINTLSLVYASLTQLDEQGTAGPGLAESWEYNADGTEVTFTLRPNLKFSDGTALDAEAVRTSLLRGKTQDNSLLKDQLSTIKDVQAPDATTVVVQLQAPDYQVPLLLAGKTGAIVSPKAIEENVSGLPTAPVGAGPFKFESFIPESQAIMVANPEYWDAADISIDRLELTVAPDPATIVTAVQSGAIDVATLQPRLIDQAKSAGLGVDISPTLTVNQVDVNSTLPGVDDPTVVEALKYAVDRQQLVDVITAGQGKVTYQPFPPDYIAYDPELDDRFAYDPEKARALLAEAGHGPDDPLDLTITAAAYNQQQAELVQAQLQVVGVNSTIKIVPPGSSTWQQEVYLGRNAQFALDGTVGRESPVQNLTVVYGAQGLMNTSKVATPEFLAALDKVRQTPLDDPNYQTVLHEAVALGVEQNPSFSTFNTPRVTVRSEKVSELPPFISQYRWEGVTVQP